MQFLSCWDKVSALEDILGPSGDRSGLVDRNIYICREVFAIILFVAVYGQWQAWINGLIELCDVVVDVGLSDISVLV